MNTSVLYSVGAAFLIPLGVKTALYFGWFKRRKCSVSLLTCFLLAGAPLIPLGVAGLPIVVGWAAGIGIALFILSRYTSVELLPLGIVSVVGIEIFYIFLDRCVLHFFFT
jgi:hypothetical protein